VNDEVTLEQLERQWVAALLARDVTTLSALWSDGFIFTDPYGHSLSRDRCLAQIASGEIAFTRGDVLALHVRVIGDTGVVFAVIALAGQAGQFSYDGELSVVDVYQREGGQWRAVLSSGDHMRAIMAAARSNE
jgi:ketosteroid isomerase-like protein